MDELQRPHLGLAWGSQGRRNILDRDCSYRIFYTGIISIGIFFTGIIPIGITIPYSLLTTSKGIKCRVPKDTIIPCLKDYEAHSRSDCC